MRKKARNRQPSAVEKRTSESPEKIARRERIYKRLRVIPWIALLLVLGAGLYCRIGPAYESVFPTNDRIDFFDVDSYYHVRHAQFSAKHFPHVLRFDVGTHYPKGEVSRHPGLFNIGIAAVSWIVSLGEPSHFTVERVAAWTPIALYIVIFFAVFYLTRRMTSTVYGVVACAILTLHPGLGLTRSLVGFADHHIAEMALLLLTVIGLYSLLEERSERLRPALIRALPFPVFVWTWAGAPIHLLPIGLVLAALIGFELARGIDPKATTSAIVRWAGGVIIWMVLPLALYRDIVLILDYYDDAIVCLGLLLIGSLLIVPIARFMREHRVPAPVIASAFLCIIAIGLTGTAIAADNRLIHELIGTKSNLVADHTVFTPELVYKLGGLTTVFAAAAIPTSFFVAWKTPDRRFILLPIMFGVLLHASSYQTHDYGYQLGSFAAIMGALFLAVVLSYFKPLHALIIGTLVGALTVAHWPLGWAYSPVPNRELIRSLKIVHDGWIDSLSWLKTHTPAPTVPVDAIRKKGPDAFGEKQSYGVYVQWSYGSFVSYLAERAPVWSHGIHSESTAWLFTKTEEESLKKLCPACNDHQSVRYVILEADSLGRGFVTNTREAGLDKKDYERVLGKLKHEKSTYDLMTYGLNFGDYMAGRLYYLDGEDVGHYRLVYESKHRTYIGHRIVTEGGSGKLRKISVPIDRDEEAGPFLEAVKKGTTRYPQGYLYGGVVSPSIKIFEVVKGAKLNGTTDPGADVTAELPLIVKSSGRKFIYKTKTKADTAGNFSVVLPYSSRDPSGETKPGGDWQISVLPLGETTPRRRLLGAISESYIVQGKQLTVGKM